MRLRINGRRGTLQLLFALVYMIIGYTYFVPDGDRIASLRWFAEILPIWALGWVWIGAGVFGVAGSFLSRPRDRISFEALTFVPIVLSVVNIIGWAVSDNERGLIFGVMYLIVAGIIITISGVQGDTDRDKRPVRNEP